MNMGDKDACPHQASDLLVREDLRNDELRLVMIVTVDSHQVGLGGQGYLGEQFPFPEGDQDVSP